MLKNLHFQDGVVEALFRLASYCRTLAASLSTLGGRLNERASEQTRSPAAAGNMRASGKKGERGREGAGGKAVGRGRAVGEPPFDGRTADSRASERRTETEDTRLELNTTTL